MLSLFAKGGLRIKWDGDIVRRLQQKQRQRNRENQINQNKNELKTLTITHLRGPLFLFSFGNFLAIASLIVEIWWHKVTSISFCLKILIPNLLFIIFISFQDMLDMYIFQEFTFSREKLMWSTRIHTCTMNKQKKYIKSATEY